MANTDIRRLAKANDVPLWRICRELSISEPTMTRRLRYELQEDDKAKYREIIKRLAEREAE